VANDDTARTVLEAEAVLVVREVVEAKPIVSSVPFKNQRWLIEH
jgi:hypothetical protein